MRKPSLKTNTDGSQRKYYYDGISVILEKTKPAQGSWTTSKVYTLGGGDIGFIIADREISGQNNTDKWYHYDRLGNVMAQTNSSGQASTTYDQDAFGNVLSGSQNGYHLTTKDNHNEIGLYYFYKRWYDPILGRFTIKSSFSPDEEHPYIYCENDPVNAIDPSGLLTKRYPGDNPVNRQFLCDCYELCKTLREACEKAAKNWFLKKACALVEKQCRKECDWMADKLCEQHCDEFYTACATDPGSDPAKCDVERQMCRKACEEKRKKK